MRSWIVEVGVPYAQGEDGGTVTNDELAAALRGPGVVVAKLGASFLSEPAAFGAKVRVSSRLDGNGVLDPVTEIAPSVEAMLDLAFAPTGNTYVYAAAARCRRSPPTSAR